MQFRCLEILACGVLAAKLLDFTAGTCVAGPSNLATSAIVIPQLISHSNFTFLQSKIHMLDVFTEFCNIEKTTT